QTERMGARPGPAGLRFGPYRVLGQVGVGGMAAVYSAARESDGRTVALKVLPAGWGAAPELRARLERESAIMRRLQHPGVIRLLDVGAVGDHLGGGTYIAMEWIPDGLDRVLRARFPEPLEQSPAIRIAIGLADALAAIHAAGLV